MSNKVRILCRFRCVRPKSIAVWDGETLTVDGNEEWTWLPRSQVTWRKFRNSDGVIVTVPRYIAEERRLAWLPAQTEAESRRMAEERIEAGGWR